MKKKKKNLIRKVVNVLLKQLPLFIGLSVVWYAYNVTTEEQRQKIWFAIKGADYKWLFISMVIGLFSHWWRAARWEILLNPLGVKTKQHNRFPITMIAYLANMGVPRSGEILRAAMLSKRENVTFEKAFGTIIIERLIDFLILCTLIILAFVMNADLIWSILPDQIDINYLPLVLMALFTVLGFVYLIKKKPKYSEKIITFLKSLIQALRDTLKIKRRGMFLFYTVLIWGAYVLMIWIPSYSLDQIGSLSLSTTLMVFVASSLSIVFTNGGIGVFPLAVAASLSYSGVSEVYGEAFGWLVWLSQTIMILIGGSFSYLYLKIKKH